MDNLARKLNQENEILTIHNIHKVDELYYADTILDKAYEVYKEVEDGLAKPFPIILLPRLREDFNKHNTLVAIDNNNQVVGVAIIEKLENPEEATSRFGKSTTKYCKQVYGFREPLYELEAIAVKPNMRKKGIGQAFYEAAKKYTDNRCVAIVTEANIAGQKTALAGGFSKIEKSLFNAPFSVADDGHAYLDIENGKHIVKANLYASKRKYEYYNNCMNVYPLLPL